MCTRGCQGYVSTHSPESRLKSNFFFRLSSSSSGSSFVQQKSMTMAINGESAKTILATRQAISKAAAVGSVQSTSKKLFPSVETA
mmetsp:Transcript_4573/g.5486  ORF Transcript_4573/g.5486 Transcript_4573/m.5486 type:complete len:85 (+) Transcript_4573:123-377(+)